jgi:predicted lactoylglutathione lyase
MSTKLAVNLPLKDHATSTRSFVAMGFSFDKWRPELHFMASRTPVRRQL